MRYIKKYLDNGIYIIMVPMQNTQVINMGFFIKAGARNETDENNGIAHFLEHMMFKGTKHRTSDQLFNQLDTLGTIYNAATTMQHTYYYINGISDNTKELLDIMLDLYIYPTFNTKEINKEKKVIIEEMRMRRDSPMSTLYTKIHTKMFSGTTLSHNIIGTVDSINSFVKKDFIKFRSALYKPENTVFVIAGNFAPKPTYQILEKFLRPLENNNLPIPNYVNDKVVIFNKFTEQKEPYIYIKKNPAYDQAYVIFVFPMYDLYNYKFREIDLLTRLLSSGFSSRLSKALREKNGITYSSTAYPVVYSDCGIFLIQMIVNPTELIQGVKIVLKELSKINSELMTNDEMKKIINVTKNDVIYSLMTPNDILQYFGINFLANREFKPDLAKEFTKIKKVTKAQIRDVAKEIFTRDKLNLFMNGNITETDFSFINI